MTTQELRIVHRTAMLHFALALGFLGFFQLSKASPLREVNPFGDDPYDAVGSVAVQLALLCGALSYARALRLLHTRDEVPKTRLILRGDLIVLTAVFTALAADGFAEAARPQPASFLGSILLLALLGLASLGCVCSILLARAFSRIQFAPAPTGLTPADAIDDLWTLIRLPLSRAAPLLPRPILNWIEHFSSDRLFSRLRWLDPRLHPWRFAALVGVLSGGLLTAAQFREGLPPSAKSAIIVASIIISVEASATMVGFALFGGQLGLRPTGSTKPRALPLGGRSGGV